MSTTGKPWLTRRRIIAAAVLLLVATVAVICEVGGGDSPKKVTVTFVGFEKSEDNKLTFLTAPRALHDHLCSPAAGCELNCYLA
jgi:hypothetical protein